VSYDGSFFLDVAVAAKETGFERPLPRAATMK
jgi:hypothetical protein